MPVKGFEKLILERFDYDEEKENLTLYVRVLTSIDSIKVNYKVV